MRRMYLAAGLALLAGTPCGAAAPDPYGPPPPVGTPGRLDRDAMLGLPGAEGAILAWLSTHPNARVADRRALFHRLCELFGVRSWHAMRARACTAAQDAGTARAGDDDPTMAAALADTLPIRAIGTADIALEDNFLGSRAGPVTVRGITLSWFVDTGAEISVLPQSNADRLGVRYVGGNVSVGTTTADVIGRVGVIDLLRIGDATVENVPVLVLPDNRLRIYPSPDAKPGTGRMIEGILGLPVFAAFRRMAWSDGGSRLMLGEAAPRPGQGAAKIYWHPDGLGVPLAIGGRTFGAHFDSGASQTYLYDPAARTLVPPAVRATAIRRTVRTGGAGGTVEQRLEELPRLDARLGATLLNFRAVPIQAHEGTNARVGNDAIRQLRLLVFDFDQMTMEALPLAGSLVSPSGAPSAEANQRHVERRSRSWAGRALARETETH